jgi:hypothetical protein
MRILFILTCFALTSFFVAAQTPEDGFMMPKGEVCAALPASQNNWSEYWEGSLQRNNPNLGTITTQMLMPMATIGVTNTLNVIVSLPYVSTSASAGTLRGHEGLQDLSVWLKYQPLRVKIGKSSLSFDILGGFATPASSYFPDYMPLSIGLGCKDLNAKSTLHLETPQGFFATANGGFQYRTNVRVNRTQYYTDQGYTNEEADMPNLSEWKVAAGYVKNHVKANLVYAAFNTLGGTDIRRNDMPFPSTNMDGTRVGGELQIYLGKSKALSLLAFGNKVLSGRNIGLSTTFGGGIAYQFRLF